MRGECTILGKIITQITDSAKTLAFKIKESSNKAKRCAFAAIAFVAIIANFTFTGARIAYKINLDGNAIATVGNKQQYNDALQLVVDLVGGTDVSNTVAKPQFSTVFVLDNNLNSTQEVADAIINNTDEIVLAATLYVDGQAVLTAEKSVVESETRNRLNRFNVVGQNCSSAFVEKIHTVDSYCLASSLADKQKVTDTVNSLSVITEMREVNDIVVPYESVVEKTKEQVKGYKEVAVSGVAGLNRVTQDVVMLNGTVQSSTLIDTQVVVAPIDEVVVEGAAKSELEAQKKQEAAKAGFIFPLPSGAWQVSSYYGDGRNHKGVDLRAPSGTSIFAVLEGTVVYSGWRGDYGYCVIVEHPNGLRTLYAHAKKLCCNAGDTVAQGDVIALVGTTGQSTGNHLHFEVITGGKKVNPAPYINLD